MADRRERQILQGDPRLLGTTRIGSGYHFAAVFDTDDDVSLLLYEKGGREPVEAIPVDRSYFTGNVAAFYVPDLAEGTFEYNYRTGDRILQDPCAQRILGRGGFGELPDPEDPHGIRCGFGGDYDWEDDASPDYPFSGMILYKLHVRGYTMQRNSRVKNKGTFRGIAEKIPYFQELGITALELMPVYDFDEVLLPQNLPLEFASRMKEKTKVNFWGYAPGNYFAPKPAYGAGDDPVAELKDLVKALHRAGIECILEFFFPGGMPGLTVLQILRHWRRTYRVDGFHLVGDGVPAELVCQDPALKGAKLLLPWLPAGCGHRGSAADRRIAVCSEEFKQDMRRFLKSDEDSLGRAVAHIRKNPAGCGVVNYLTSQDGFTMADLVSYDMKHNEANGEDNRDGCSYNFSWNCGAEGPTRKRSVRLLRERQMQNGFLFMLLSQGIPMIYGGDEFANSQLGNNNAYCQDNETGWVDWRAYGRNQALVKFVREAIRFRKKHRILHMDSELRIMDYRSCGFPDLSYHSSKAWVASFDNVSYFAGVMYCGHYAVNEDGEKDDFLYVAYNFHWEPYTFALPNLPGDAVWAQVAETGEIGEEACFPEDGEPLEDQKMVRVKPRSIGIFIGRRERK